MFLFHKKSFHMIPSAIIYNKKWNKREKCVFFVNQNFSMPVFTFWSVSRAFCWWVEIQNNKNKNMLKNVERQTIYMHMYERLNEFLCVLFCGGNCAGCASFESFFYYSFYSHSLNENWEHSHLYFLHFISLKNHPPFNFHSFFHTYALKNME